MYLDTTNKKKWSCNQYIETTNSNHLGSISSNTACTVPGQRVFQPVLNANLLSLRTLHNFFVEPLVASKGRPSCYRLEHPNN